MSVGGIVTGEQKRSMKMPGKGQTRRTGIFPSNAASGARSDMSSDRAVGQRFPFRIMAQSLRLYGCKGNVVFRRGVEAMLLDQDRL